MRISDFWQDTARHRKTLRALAKLIGAAGMHHPREIEPRSAIAALFVG